MRTFFLVLHLKVQTLERNFGIIILIRGHIIIYNQFLQLFCQVICYKIDPSNSIKKFPITFVVV